MVPSAKVYTLPYVSHATTITGSWPGTHVVQCSLLNGYVPALKAGAGTLLNLDALLNMEYRNSQVV